MMQLLELLKSKTLKGKQKTEEICQLLIKKELSTTELIEACKNLNDNESATCIEALEFASRINPSIGSTKVIDFAIENLGAKAPRIKWESAKVIANVIHLNKDKCEMAITALLQNTEHKGTVVRWSAAVALSEIIKLKTKINKDLIPAVEAITESEEKNSIRKIYAEALKKAKISK